tara:strand:+ start:78 stop:431 length:354 start_codon:yes stop_codon:yes gene_type:complete
MGYTKEYFTGLLCEAIKNYEENNFKKTVNGFSKDIILSDDGSFEDLVDKYPFIIYIHELLDNWTESISNPSAYEHVAEEDWVQIAVSLKEDIEKNKVPSHEKWKYIYVHPKHEKRIS